MSKTIDILNDIIYRNSVSYTVGYENKTEILSQIEALEKLNLFSQYGMCYKYVESTDYIALVIHKDFSFNY